MRKRSILKVLGCLIALSENSFAFESKNVENYFKSEKKCEVSKTIQCRGENLAIIIFDKRTLKFKLSSQRNVIGAWAVLKDKVEFQKFFNEYEMAAFNKETEMHIQSSSDSNTRKTSICIKGNSLGCSYSLEVKSEKGYVEFLFTTAPSVY